MTPSSRGLVFGVAAYGIWGLFPLFWPLLEPASALEILASRVLFSALVVGALLSIIGSFRPLRRIGKTAFLRLSAAGGVIAVNWGAYIWAVNHDHVVQASLGYFINPLVTVGLAMVVLHERLRLVQWAALGLGALAVFILTLGAGHVPWLALTLAASFGIYGLLKKQVGVTAVQGLAVETTVLLVPALVVLGVLAARGTATWVGPQASIRHLSLLAAAGPVTVVPLLFFAGAARRLSLTSLGLLQYLAPVLQFAIGVGLRHEAMFSVRLAGFSLVWLALAVLTVDALRHRGAGAQAPLGRPAPTAALRGHDRASPKRSPQV